MNPKLKRMLWPDLTSENRAVDHLLRRVPIYMHMICMGYIFYNEIKFDRYGHIGSWTDTTGFMNFFYIAAMILWVVSLVTILSSNKKKDYPALGYLILIFIVRFAILISIPGIDFNPN